MTTSTDTTFTETAKTIRAEAGSSQASARADNPRDGNSRESNPHEGNPVAKAKVDRRHLSLKTVWMLLRSTFLSWITDDAQRLAAALAYYAVFSLVPILIIVIGLTSIYFGRAKAQQEIVWQVQGLVGTEGATLVQQMIDTSLQERSGWRATLVGLVTLLVGASGAFAQLQGALNHVWGVRSDPKKALLTVLRARFFSFAMILVVGFLLLVSLILSAWLAALGNFVGSYMPEVDFLMQAMNFMLSFLVITFLFALIYKVLPDVEIGWRDVWLGAAGTALLFSLGKYAIGLYLGNSVIVGSFGTAGALVVLLIWIYYSAQIFLLGAEFIQVYANWRGVRLAPTELAVPIETLRQSRLLG